MKFEEAAEQATAKGWKCKTCNRFSGDERIARWCCATDLPCECGGRSVNKHYTCCENCRRKKDAERWEKLLAKAVEWDGRIPLYSDSLDRYFLDAEQLGDYFDDLENGEEGTTLPELRLRLCTPNNGRHFCMSEYLEDDLPADDPDCLDDAEINKLVNDWIKEHAPFSWFGDGPAVTVESVIKHSREA